jgi:hypothetical protein
MALRGLSARLAAHATLLTAGLGQPMLQMYGDSPAVFTSADLTGAQVVVFGLATLLVPVAVLGAADAASLRLPAVARARVRTGLLFVSAMPLGMLLTRTLPGPWAASLCIAGVLAAAVTWLHGRFGTVRTWLSWMSLYVPAVFVIFVLATQSVIWQPAAGLVEVAPTTVADAPGRRIDPQDVSVLWLQLDEAPLWPLLRTDGTINGERFPGFAALAAGSTWYRDMLGVSQTTVDAVPATLTGTMPVTGRAPTFANHRRNLFSLMYRRRAFDVREMATALCPKEACASISVSGSDEIAAGGGRGVASTTTVADPPESAPAEAEADLGQFWSDAFVVLGHKLLPRGLRDGLPAIDEGWGGFGANNDVDVIEDDAGADGAAGTGPAPATTAVPTTVGIGPVSTTVPARFIETVPDTQKNTVRRWETNGARSQVPVVEDMVLRAARSDVPTLHFAHVLLPHRPWQLTPDMRTTRFVSTDKRGPEVEDRVRDEYQAFLAQYAATDALVLDLVTRMKKSANWDRTMIVVTSDHGIAFEPGESKRKEVNPRRPDTLEQIYRVPLFIKYPGQATGAVDDCPAQSQDILPTVVAATALDAGWDFDGVDLASTCPQRGARTVAWPGGSATLASGADAAVATARRFDEWVDADGGTDAIARTEGFGDWFGVDVPLQVPDDPSVSRWTLRDRALFANIATGRFMSVPLQFDGTFTAVRRVPADAVGLVEMDGRVVAVIPEIASATAGTSPYRSMVLPSSLTSGRKNPRLFIARGTPSSPVITSVGPPSG